MGTFHQDKGELHGITVVVETREGRLYVGRCDTVLPEGVVLLQGDVHAEGEPAGNGKIVSREAFLDHAVRFGVWPTFERFVVPAESVTSVQRLGALAS